MKKKMSFKGRFYITFWVVILLSFGVAISLQLNKYNAYLKQEAQVKLLIEEETKKAKELIKDKDYYESDVFVEKIAREQLDLVRPDERLFYNDAKQ